MAPQPTEEAQAVQITVLGITMNIVDTSVRPRKVDAPKLPNVVKAEAEMAKLADKIEHLKILSKGIAEQKDTERAKLDVLRDKKNDAFEMLNMIRAEQNRMREKERETRAISQGMKGLSNQSVGLEREIAHIEGKLKEVLTLKDEKWYVERLQTLKRSQTSMQKKLQGMLPSRSSDGGRQKPEDGKRSLQDVQSEFQDQRAKVLEDSAKVLKMRNEAQEKVMKVREELAHARDGFTLVVEKLKEVRDELKKTITERREMKQQHFMAVKAFRAYLEEQRRRKMEEARALEQARNVREHARRKAADEEWDKQQDIDKFLRISVILEFCWGLLRRLERGDEGADNDAQDDNQEECSEAAGQEAGEGTPGKPKGRGRAAAKPVFKYHMRNLQDFAAFGLTPPSTKEELQAAIATLEEKLLESDKTLDRWRWDPPNLFPSGTDFRSDLVS